MARKKLSVGFHTVNMKKKGGGTQSRRVQVLKNGQWKFLKGSGKSKSKPSKSSKKPKKSSKGQGSNNPGGGRTTSNRMNPFKKNGINVPVALIDGGLILGVFEDPDGGDRGAYVHATEGNYARAATEYARAINPFGNTMSGKAIRWGAGLSLIRRFTHARPVQIGPLIF